MVNTTSSANIALNKPEVNSATDEDLWGGYLNTNMDNIDTFLTGKETIWLPAQTFSPTVTNGCSVLTSVELSAAQPNLQVLDFNDTSDEFAEICVRMPKQWDESTVTFIVYWTTSATTGSVVWSLEAVAISNDDPIGATYGTAVTVTDTALGTANDLHISAESSALTIGGTPALGDLLYFKISRDANNGSDTMSGDARLIGAVVIFDTDAANDD